MTTKPEIRSAGFPVKRGLRVFCVAYFAVSLAWLLGMGHHTLGRAFFFLLIAAFEEFLFRGLLLRWLSTKLNAVAAIGVSAAVFTLYHRQVAQAPTIFLGGVLLSLTFLMTRSLWPAILLHAAHNNFHLGVVGPLPLNSSEDPPLFNMVVGISAIAVELALLVFLAITYRKWLRESDARRKAVEATCRSQEGTIGRTDS